METGNLIWLIAGIGIGLVLAMGLFAGLSWLERRRLVRRLRAARATGTGAAIVDPPKAALAAASLLARASQRSDPQAVEPQARPVSVPPLEAAEPVQLQPIHHETRPAEPPPPAVSAGEATFGPDEADAAEPLEQRDVAPAPIQPVADEPAVAKPNDPPRVGIQAAVAEAAARRRAAREAGLLPKVPPPVVPAASGSPDAAGSEAAGVNVEELFEKAFGTATPLVPGAGSADDGEKAS